MTPRARILTIVFLAFTGLLVFGFWVGAFETFGGYVSRKRIFFGASLAIGLLTALMLHLKWEVHCAAAGAFFVLSHCFYVLGQAFGQTFYVGPKDAGDFVHTLFLALNDRL